MIIAILPLTTPVSATRSASLRFSGKGDMKYSTSEPIPLIRWTIPHLLERQLAR